MLNSTLTQTIQVSEDQTAISLGSGTLPVFATPALIALMENTAMKLLSNLPEGNTSVGVSINIQHLKASPIGALVECSATISANEGRKYTFTIKAIDAGGNLIGEGVHERVVVNIEKFMSKIS
jgi:fluoroacetyl-CoA thioesterase